MSKSYTIENQRPRRTVTLYGRTLAPKGRGRTSSMQLTEEQLLGTPCVRLLQLNRVALVHGEAPVELLALLSASEEAAPSAEAPPGSPEGSISATTNSPVEDADPGSGSETPSEEAPESDTPSPTTDAGPSLADHSYVWTAEELTALNASDQKAICRNRGLQTSGREADRVQRILDAQSEGT